MQVSTLNFGKAIEALLKFSDIAAEYSGKLQDYGRTFLSITAAIQDEKDSIKKQSLQSELDALFSNMFFDIPKIAKAYNGFIENFSLYINLSILAGEHYSPKLFSQNTSLSKFKEINESLTKSVETLFVDETIYNRIVKFLGGESEKVFKRKVDFLSSELDKYYQFYHRLARFAQANLDFQDNHTYVDTSFEDIIYDSTLNDTLSDLKNYLSKKSSSQLHQNRLYFIINAKLAEIDDCFNCDEKLCRNLLELRAFFFDCKTFITQNSIGEILRDKTNYLLAKMFRQLREKKMVLRDLNNNAILDIASLIDSNNHYNSFNVSTEKICTSLFTNSEITEIEQKPRKSFFEYHFLSKSYRIQNDLSKLNKLENEFAREYQFIMLKNDQEALFDKQAFLSLKSQLLNNQLRACIETGDEDLSFHENKITNQDISNIEKLYNKLDTLIKKIEEFQDEFNYRSYYPFVIYIKFLNKILKVLIEGIPSEGLALDGYRKLIIKISERQIEILIRSKKNLNWSKERCLLAAYMPFNECLVESPQFHLEDEPIKLFLDSAYCKPLYYEGAESEIEDEEGDSKRLISKANTIILNLKAEALSQQFDKKTTHVIEDTKQTSKDSAIKNIEILGVFTALMAFIFTSTDVFKSYFAKDDNSKLKIGHAISISVATAIGLSLFVFLINSLLRKEDSTHRLIYFIVWILFFLFLATYIIGNS
jgi:hypothetical protein